MTRNSFSILFTIVVFLSILIGGCKLQKLINEPIINSPETKTTPSTPIPSPSPTSCTGWQCEITGVVSAGSVETNNQFESEKITLKQISWCSPTSGIQETQLDADGRFTFNVYLHDTDSFVIDVNFDGYKPETVKFGGFDCLYCNCGQIEIILEAIDRQ